MFEEVKVGENELCVFYTDRMTENLDKGAGDLKGIRCLIAENKTDGSRVYLLTRDGVILQDNTNLEAIFWRIEAMKRLALEK